MQSPSPVCTLHQPTAPSDRERWRHSPVVARWSYPHLPARNAATQVPHCTRLPSSRTDSPALLLRLFHFFLPPADAGQRRRHASSRQPGKQGSVYFYSPYKGFAAGGSVSAYNTAAISADGNILAGDTRFADPGGKPLGMLAQPPALYGNALSVSYPTDSRTTQLRGSHFNAFGSLYYMPHAGYSKFLTPQPQPYGCVFFP